MVLMLGGNPEMLRTNEGRSFEEKNPICDCPRSNQMPLNVQTTEIDPYVRTYF